MRRFLPILPLLLLAASLTSDQAAAGDWRFRRSYFSHNMAPEWPDPGELPRSRSAYRAAWPNPLPGFSVQGAYRFNRIQINSGQSSDTTILRGGWFQLRY